MATNAPDGDGDGEVEAGDVSPIQPVSTIVSTVLDTLESTFESMVAPGLTTGARSFDALTGGLQPGSFNLLAGPPGCGKTAFGLRTAANVVLEHDRPVFFVTYETSATAAVRRLLGGEVRVKTANLRDGRMEELDWQKFSTAVGRIGNSSLYLAESPTMSVLCDLVERLLKMEPTLGLIVIDGLGLAEEYGLRNVGMAMRGLAATHQLSVLASLTTAGTATLKKLRGLVGVADLIATLDFAEGESLEFSIRSNRYGASGSISMGFNPATGHFWA